MKNNWDIYDRYKSLHALPDSAVLTAFESIIMQISLYDTIEFSTKFKRQDNTFDQNPLRFSLWKYGFNSQQNAEFLRESFRFFDKAAENTPAADRLQELTSVRLAVPGSDLRFVSTGVEIHHNIPNTRLKLYAGYKPKNRTLPHFLIRHELDLQGRFFISKYEALSTADPAVRFRLSDVPETFWKQPFAVVFVQADRLHFKFDPDAVLEAKVKTVTDLISDAEVLHSAYRICENGFDPVVLTFHRGEIVQGKINAITLYVRDADWKQLTRIAER